MEHIGGLAQTTGAAIAFQTARNGPSYPFRGSLTEGSGRLWIYEGFTLVFQDAMGFGAEFKA